MRIIIYFSFSTDSIIPWIVSLNKCSFFAFTQFISHLQRKENSCYIMLNIVLLGLAEDLPEKDEEYELHRLLGALLSSKLKVDEKLDIIGNEFQIPLESDIRKDVSEMCNLSQGIEERGVEKGLAEAAIRMYKKGYSIEQISDILAMDIERVKDIIENK